MPKRLSTYAGLALLVASGAAFAQQPLTLPGRSQTSAQQSVDNAACYAYANQSTKVIMARESQAPQKDNTVQTRTLISPRAVEPPLPPGAQGASAAVAASGASATAAAGASSVPGARAGAAAGASATAVAGGASGTMGASGAMPAMPAMASGASDAILSGDMKMPPLPPPEPPMVRYWRAYSDCMQNRGYFVR